MEFKYFVLFCLLGISSAYTLSKGGNSEVGPSFELELEGSLSPSSHSTDGNLPFPSIPIHSEDVSSGFRVKRDLFKNWVKDIVGDTILVNRQYEQGGYNNQPRREVHHVHHYSNPPPPSAVVERTYIDHAPSRPASEYQYSHGGYSGGNYYVAGGGNYYSRPVYYPAPSQQQPAAQGPVQAVPKSSTGNQVGRGQGAAAVNNIAIIHARAGASSSSGHNSPEDIDDLISRAGFSA